LLSKDGTESKMAFQHIPSEVGAVEAEEVGVEHLLRDIHDPSVSTMGSNVNAKLVALKSLVEHLKEVQAYVDNVCQGKLPINQKIVGQLQDIFNLLPNINIEEMTRSFAEVGSKKVESGEDKEKKGEKANTKEKENKKAEESSNTK